MAAAAVAEATAVGEDSAAVDSTRVAAIEGATGVALVATDPTERLGAIDPSSRKTSRKVVRKASRRRCDAEI